MLPDGRTVAYATYGDPAGRPVLYLHGGLSGRLDAAVLDGPAQAVGVRILAPDRPGIGGSDRSAAPDVATVAADVPAFAHALGVDRFALLAWSGGAPYAMATLAAGPGRVGAAALVGAMAPLDVARRTGEFGLLADRVLFALAERAPWAMAAALSAARRLPDAALRFALASDVDPAERDLVRDLDLTFLRAAFAGGVAGTVDDYRRLGTDWGFRLADVRAPVTLWQGTADRLVPPSHARALAELLPAAQVRKVPGAGHFLLHHHAQTVLASLI